MFGDGFARRPAPLELLDLGRAPRRRLGRELVFGGAGGQLIEFELQLPEQPFFALRAPSVERTPQLLNHQRQGGDLDLRIRDLGLGRGQGRTQPLDLSSGTVGGLRSVGRGAAVHHPQGKANRPTAVIECSDGPINPPLIDAMASRARELLRRRRRHSAFVHSAIRPAASRPPPPAGWRFPRLNRTSPRPQRTPGPHRVAPIDPLEQVAELGGADRHRPARRRRLGLPCHDKSC